MEVSGAGYDCLRLVTNTLRSAKILLWVARRTRIPSRDADDFVRKAARRRPGGLFWRQWIKRSEPVQRLPERVQPQRAEVQGLPVEHLEVEVGAPAGLRIIPGLQPDPLADLVRRGLTRPAQVALPLE